MTPTEMPEHLQMDDEWNFEDLAKLKLSVLKKIRNEKQDRLAQLRQERFSIAGQIMFYQRQITEEEKL